MEDAVDDEVAVMGASHVPGKGFVAEYWNYGEVLTPLGMQREDSLRTQSARLLYGISLVEQNPVQ